MRITRHFRLFMPIYPICTPFRTTFTSAWQLQSLFNGTEMQLLVYFDLALRRTEKSRSDKINTLKIRAERLKHFCLSALTDEVTRPLHGIKSEIT